MDLISFKELFNYLSGKDPSTRGWTLLSLYTRCPSLVAEQQQCKSPATEKDKRELAVSETRARGRRTPNTTTSYRTNNQNTASHQKNIQMIKISYDKDGKKKDI